MADKEILLSIQHLEQFFKKGARQIKAVNDLTFDVPQGELLAVIGEAGCGKTTLGKSITRKLNATGGSVYFHGLRICAGVRRYYEGIDLCKAKCKADVAELKKRGNDEKNKILINRKHKACKAECKRLTNEIIRAEYDHDHVDKELAKFEQRAVDAKYAETVPQAAKRQLTIQLAEINAAKDAERRKAMTEEQKEVIDVKYSVLLSQKEAELKSVSSKHSDGDEQQTTLLKQYKRERRLAAKDKLSNKIRLVQANALASKNAFGANTELLIVDAPANFDATVEQQALSSLAELVSKGMTVLYLTRNLSAVKDKANTVAIMRKGSLVELAPTSELFEHPCHPYTKSLLSGEPIDETHDYTADPPMMREVADGHLVYCNQAEFEVYYDELHKPKVVEVEPEVAQEVAAAEVAEEKPTPKKKTAAKKTTAKSTATKKSSTAKKSTTDKKSTTKKSTATKSTTTKKSTSTKKSATSTTKKTTTTKKSTKKPIDADDVELF